MSYVAYIRELKNRRRKKKKLKAGTRSTDAADFVAEEEFGGFDGGGHGAPGHSGSGTGHQGGSG